MASVLTSQKLARPACSVSKPRKAAARSKVQTQATVKALLFDCDGVIIESEELHRLAYNAAFKNFDVKCSGSLVVWSEEFYDMLQNKVGGGKPKMRWFFGESGWPTSSVVPGVPADDASQAILIDTLQDWKSQHYQDLVGSGTIKARPGVLRLMAEARAAGIFVGVCSAATKSSAVFTLNALLGPKVFSELDLFLAGDDASKKKPDPQIYLMGAANIIHAADKLGVDPSECVVIEDSMVGLGAARAAGMRCIITYTTNTAREPFPGAERIVSQLGDDPAIVTVDELMRGGTVQDDRVSLSVSDSAVTFN